MQDLIFREIKRNKQHKGSKRIKLMRLLSRLLNRLVNCSEINLKFPQKKVIQVSRLFSSSNLQLDKSNWGSTKSHRKIKIHNSQLIGEMADPAIEEKLAPLRACVKEQVILEVTIWFN